MPIDWVTLGAGLLAGLVGSAHCVAMCGGIATGFSAMSAQPGWWRALEPNLGRIAGYAAAGALAGGGGYGFVGLVRNEWIALGSRMLVGIVLIVVALRLLDRQGRFVLLSRPAVGLWRWLRPLQRPLLPADNAAKRIALGVLWGWMPCGLSTTLLAAAWFQADVRNGALTMTAFGIGTLPLMLPLTWSGVRIGQRLQRGGWRAAAGMLVLGAGLITLSAPWLVHAPTLHNLLVGLGCVSLPT